VSASLHRGVASVSLLLLVVISAACSPPGVPIAGPPVHANGPTPIYVAIGASETVGVGTNDPLRQAWPQLFFRDALPPSARFVDLGVPGATAAEALTQEVPAALQLQPSVVTVWLNVNDVIAGVLPSTYGSELTRLLEELRQGGRAEVLVANTPPVQALPAYRACLPYMTTATGCDTSVRAPTPSAVATTVSAYNAQIDAAATATGAHVVNLFAVTSEAIARGQFSSLISPDNFHPNARGYKLVAAAFARVYSSLR
jgi:lysophospholipase L1-like esterase